MTSAKHIAGEFLVEYLNRLPEYLDVTEFIDEQFDDVFAESDEVYAPVYEQVALVFDKVRILFYKEIYDPEED